MFVIICNTHFSRADLLIPHSKRVLRKIKLSSNWDVIAVEEENKHVDRTTNPHRIIISVPIVAQQIEMPLCMVRYTLCQDT